MISRVIDEFYAEFIESYLEMDEEGRAAIIDDLRIAAPSIDYIDEFGEEVYESLFIVYVDGEAVGEFSTEIDAEIAIKSLVNVK